ncbi:hypothetical protein FH972_010106 [Carpinus fangiana]|uniref:Uncharacterized protein n=1 Tax=Carpinus fangiana TaxID=176857 RepID=A0A660KP75_9ROSI|nr:hypothetical protein FH972_010106 [Carpinus fangiana]
MEGKNQKKKKKKFIYPIFIYQEFASDFKTKKPSRESGLVSCVSDFGDSFGTYRALRLGLFVGRRGTPKHRGGRAEVVVAVRLVAEVLAGDYFCWRRNGEVGERVGATQLDGRVVVDHGGLFGSVGLCRTPRWHHRRSLISVQLCVSWRLGGFDERI